MHEKGGDEQGKGLPSLTFKDARDRDEDERGGQIAGMQMLVGDGERRACNGQGEHGRYHGHGGPLRGYLGEEVPRNAVRCPEN
jgi:hypothetical protein